jgi:hypothetical protein
MRHNNDQSGFFIGAAFLRRSKSTFATKRAASCSIGRVRLSFRQRNEFARLPRKDLATEGMVGKGQYVEESYHEIVICFHFVERSSTCNGNRQVAVGSPFRPWPLARTNDLSPRRKGPTAHRILYRWASFLWRSLVSLRLCETFWLFFPTFLTWGKGGPEPQEYGSAARRTTGEDYLLTRMQPRATRFYHRFVTRLLLFKSLYRRGMNPFLGPLALRILGLASPYSNRNKGHNLSVGKRHATGVETQSTWPGGYGASVYGRCPHPLWRYHILTRTS